MARCLCNRVLASILLVLPLSVGCAVGSPAAARPGGSLRDAGSTLDAGGGNYDSGIVPSSCTTAGCPSTHTCNAATGRCDPISGPCAGNNPFPDCNKPCLRPADCASPTYCDHGVCTAECDPSSDTGCAAGQYCDQSGACVTGTRPSLDGGLNTGGDACVPTHVTAHPVVPTVILIIDQSLSMAERYGTSFQSKWAAVGAALTGPSGIVTQLQSVVRFGAVLYSDFVCPAQLTEIPPALDNYSSINTTLTSQGPLLFTPTGAAIQGTMDWLRTFPEVPATGNITWNGDPVVFVLATDGEADSCSPRGTSDQQYVIDTVTAAHNAGVDTYVISVALNSTNLDQAAAAGGTGSSYPANDPTALANTLSTIVKNQISCDIQLKGTIANPSSVCTDGKVQITVGGGQPSDLTCLGQCSGATGDGWCEVDASHIRLVGSACQTLQGGQSVSLDATFACGTFTFQGG